mgnify:CR=1 FL=1
MKQHKQEYINNMDKLNKDTLTILERIQILDKIFSKNTHLNELKNDFLNQYHTINTSKRLSDDLDMAISQLKKNEELKKKKTQKIMR